MTVFCFRHGEIACLFLPYQQLYLRCARNTTIFRHLLAHFPDILANALQNLTREEWWRTEKELLTMPRHIM